METKMIITVKRVPQLEIDKTRATRKKKKNTVHAQNNSNSLSFTSCLCFFFGRYSSAYTSLLLAFWQYNLIFFKIRLSFLMHICALIYRYSHTDTFYGRLYKCFATYTTINSAFIRIIIMRKRVYMVLAVCSVCSVYSEPSVFNLFMDLNDEQFMHFFLSLCFCHRKM